MKWPAKRIQNSSAKSFGMYDIASKRAAEGKDLIHLEIGRPVFDTPGHIKEATKQALDEGKVHYSDFSGELKLRQALANRLKQHNALDVSPDQVVVCNGLTHASFCAMMAAIDEGDEIILLEPYYPQHLNKVELAGGKVVRVPLDAGKDFSIDPAAIERAIGPKTSMIILVNPANPTGRVYRREELQGLADIAIRHDLLVLSDEVYEQILYDGNRHISIASLPGMMERTITCCAFTKAYAMDGWRLGYLSASPEFIPAILKISSNTSTHVNTFIQEGAHAAICGDQSCIREMLSEDEKKRDLVTRQLDRMKNVRCAPPEGTIYAFPDISATGLPSEQLAKDILYATDVVVEAGSFYGPTGEGHLRICFGAEPYRRIELAMERLTSYFEQL